jgi:hypothetical protein
MTDDPQRVEGHQSTPQRRRRSDPIRVLPPEVVPISREDREQAVTAIATMIAAWWHDHQHDPEP